MFKMELHQQQSTGNTSTDEDVTKLLQPIATKTNFSNEVTSFGRKGIPSSVARILKRSKRQESRTLLKQKCKESKYSRTVISAANSVPVVNILGDIAQAALEANENRLGCGDIPFDEIKEMFGGGFNKIRTEILNVKNQWSTEFENDRQIWVKRINTLSEQIDDGNKQLTEMTEHYKALHGVARQASANFEAVQDVSEQVAENYWAINKNNLLLLDKKGLILTNQKHILDNKGLLLVNQDLLLGNKGILLANQDLLLTNQGLILANTAILMEVALTLMVINSKMERNYRALLRVEAKVDRNYDAIVRNYEAIRRVENKVDRNLEVMLTGFKTLEHSLGNMMERGFKEVINFVRQTKIEVVTSEVITFIKHFVKEKDAVRSLSQDQYVAKLEELNGILHRLQNSRLPQPGSLHALLYNIINQRFAIPENSNDGVAFTAFSLLCSGTETYISVMSFLLEGYSYLSDFYYQKNDLEKYNDYFSLVLTTYNDFESSLAGNNGLINEVIGVLDEVKSYDFIEDEREDVKDFASRKIEELNFVKSQLGTLSYLSQEKTTEKIKYNFSYSKVKTPIGKWEDRKKVSYAIQFQSRDAYYQIGEWSTPATVYKKANPLLDIGTDPKGRKRLIFRKFINDKPELVGIVEDSKQKEFRDINRDLYNAVLEPNEDMAIDEIEILLENNADISSRYERSRQAIHAAAESGNSNIMLALINKGADINAKDINGYAPIHIATHAGYENFIKTLIDNGANVNAKTNLDWTALHVAAEKDHGSTVVNLMKSESLDINAKTKGGLTSLHIAASFGRNSVLIHLSSDNRTDINARSEDGLTPLHLASIGEYSDAVETLLKDERIDINAKTNGGLTALHFASLVGNSNIAKSLIKHSKININEISIEGWTPLHLAINSQTESVALELLSTDDIDVTTKGKNDITALHLAASRGKISVVTKLLDKGSSILDTDIYDYTPLHFAIESGHLDIVEYLSEKGASLYAEQKDGYTPLGLAAFYGKLEIVQFLVNDKNVAAIENKNGMTPIDFAASNGHSSLVEFLIDKGAEKGFPIHWAAFGGHLNTIKYLAEEKHFDFNAKDKYENLPLHNAALQGHLSIVKYFVNEKQTDLNTKNRAGYIPLLFAVLGGHLNIVKYFVDEKSVELNSVYNARDRNGNTALHLAASNGSIGVLKYLIRKGMEVDAVDNYGNTSLFLAASGGYLDKVKYLIQKGANFKMANNYGNTVLHFSVLNSHLDVVKHFVEKGADIDAINKNGDSLMHVAASADVAKYLAEKSATLKYISKNCRTCLHEAATNGNLDMVKYFHEQGISVHSRVTKINEEFNSGKTTLHLAAQSCKLDVVKYLIKERADVSSQDDSGKTPKDLADQNCPTDDVVHFLEEAQLNLYLLNAVNQGNFNKVIEYIDQGASLEIKNKDGDSLQEIASKNGSIEIVEFLEQTELNSNLITAVKQDNLVAVKECVARGANLKAKDGKSLLHLADLNKDIELFLNQAQLNLDLINAVTQDNLDVAKHLSRDVGLEVKDKNGNTLLHLAASSGCLNTAKYLVEEGADLNATNRNNSTAIHAASSNGRLDVLKYFIKEKSPSLEVIDKYGNSPLILAAKGGYLDTVKYLVEKGANLNITNEMSDSPIHVAASLDIVKYLLENGANLNATNRNGFTIFHTAASSGKLDVIKYLAEDKGANLEDKDNNGDSPLRLAAQEGHLDTVKYLVGKGADSSSLKYYLDKVKTIVDQRDINAPDKYGNMPLHLAASTRYLGIVKYLVKNGGDLHATNKDCRTPLNVAAEKGHLGIVKYFVENGANLSAPDCHERKALHWASIRNHLDVAKYLVEKGANIHTRVSMISYNDGDTALHYAVYNDSLDVIKYLLREGADPNATDKHGDTPLHIVTKYDLNMVKLLLEKSADLMAVNKLGYTPLQYVYPLDIIKYIVEKETTLLAFNGYLNLFRMVVNGSFDTQDEDGNTSLHLAASIGCSGIVEYLVNRNTELNSSNKDGNTPLHLAAEKGYLEIVKHLVGNRADLSIINKYGYNLVHQAALSGKLKLIRYLIETKKMDFEAKDQDDNSPLSLAVQKGHLDIAEYLLEKGADASIKNKNDYTLLQQAVCGGQLELVRFFIEKKEASLDVKDEDSNTLLSLAAQKGHLTVVKYLLKMGADFNLKNKNKKTPLDLAIEEGELFVVIYLVEKGAGLNDGAGGYYTRYLYLASRKGHLDIVRFFVEKGADFNDKYDHTPLHYAATGCSLNVIKYLVEQKDLDVNAVTNNKYTPLYSAAECGSLEVVKYLVEKGANVLAKNSDRNTLLHAAAGGGNLDVFKYLVEKGVNYSDENFNYFSPLHYAAKEGHLEIVKYLAEEKKVYLSSKSRVINMTPLKLAIRFKHWEVARYLESKGAYRDRRSIESKSEGVDDSSCCHNSSESSSTPDTLLDSDERSHISETINQAVNSAASQPSSWINVCVKTLVDTASSVARYIPLKPTIDMDNSPPNKTLTVGEVNANGAIFLLDLLVRKITGHKYLFTPNQVASSLESQGWALNVTDGFGLVVEEAAVESGISKHRLDIDFVEMEKEIATKIARGKFEEIPKILRSYVEKSCPGRDAGCPGMLSSKKYDKFMSVFNKRLNMTLDKSILRILHSEHNVSDVEGEKQQQRDYGIKKIKSSLDNVFNQGHLAQDADLKIDKV